MDSYIALTLFGAFFILVFIGVPISFAIGIATVGSMLLMFPWDIAVITVSQRLANGLDNFALLAIPFFIFAARIYFFCVSSQGIFSCSAGKDGGTGG